jgi:hypothetical protein
MADTKKEDSFLPIKIHENGHFEKLSPEQKKEVLLKKAEEYKKNIGQDLKGIKSDLLKVALVVGSAFLAYQFTRYLLSPSEKADKKTKKSKKENLSDSEKVYIQTEKPSKSGLWGIIQTRIAGFVLDTVLEELKDKFQKRNLSDDQ